MKFEKIKSKWNNGYALVLLLVLLNIAIRLPITPHEVGADSFITHSMANSISVEHRAKWSFHPGEIFEMHAGSYPVVVPLDLSIFSQYTGLDVEKTILFFCIFLGIMGMLSSYLMAREISRDRSFTFLVAFCFSLSPIFVSFTLWTVSTRNMFLALLPLFIWCFLKSENTTKKKYMFLAFLFFILLIPVHHMVVLTFSIWGAYILTKLYPYLEVKIRTITKYLPIHLPAIFFILFMSILLSLFFVVNTFLETLIINTILFFLILILWCVVYLFRGRYLHFKAKIGAIPNYLSWIIPLILGFLFISSFLLQFFSGLKFFERLKWHYSSGMFFKGWENYKIFLNMVVDYWSSEGILFPFAFLGFVILLKNVNKNRRYLFLTLILLFCTPGLMHGEYMNMFLSPIFAVLVGLGLIELTKKLSRYRRITVGFIVVCLITSLLFSNFMMYYWIFRMPHPSRGITQWMDEKTYHAALFLNEVNSGGPIIVVNDGTGIRMQALANIPLVDHNLWVPIVTRPYIRSLEVFSEYDMQYVVENENIYGRIISGSLGTPVHSAFFGSVHRDKDKIYDNGLEGIWSLG